MVTFSSKELQGFLDSHSLKRSGVTLCMISICDVKKMFGGEAQLIKLLYQSTEVKYFN
jgi:hypothetical protein